MRGADDTSERAPESVERFVKQLLIAYRAAALYPPTSEIPRNHVAGLLDILADVLRDRPELRLETARDTIHCDALPVLPGMRSVGAMAREFYNRNLAEVCFHAGVTANETLSFLGVMQEPAESFAAAGGFEQRLWDLRIEGITVRVVSTTILDAGSDDVSEEWPPPRQRIDALIDAARGLQPRDRRLLVRFTGTTPLLTRYLGDLAADTGSAHAPAHRVGSRFVELAHMAAGEPAESRQALLRSLGEALLSLDPYVRRSVLTERLLPEARLDDAVAPVIRELDLEVLCAALVEGVESDAVAREGLARALRNLATISVTPTGQLLTTAGGAMRAAGMDESAIGAVLEGVAPTHLAIRGEDDSRAGGLESVLRLVDLAPVAAESLEDNTPDLRAEVAGGVSDGAILVSVVTLVTLERRPVVFDPLMGMVEDGIGLLLERGEYVDAAAAAAALSALLESPTVDAAQAERVRGALLAMASPRHMRDISTGIRVHAPGTAEHDACRQLITTLGDLAIAPLLEVLAEEPDMASRKSLVDLLSEIAPSHIDKLGERTADSRWYLVRNVVAILGSTHSPAVLHYLGRTLRHADARVRRETIRGVASIRDRMADEMLMAALSDDSPQNVSLAARSLGTIGSRDATPALGAVARGEGRGARDTTVRLEAIEALARIGTTEAHSVIAALARHRGMLRGGRTREIQAAAEAAAARISRAREGGGAR